MLIKVAATSSPDYVINCAAMTNVDICERDKELAYNVNVNGIKNIISATSKDTKLVHISTDWVNIKTRKFGNPHDVSQATYRQIFRKFNGPKLK